MSRLAQLGTTVVTLQLVLVPENGFVPESLFDMQGIVSLVVGWGNYLPGLHELLLDTKTVGDSCSNMSIDAGWGERQDDLILSVSKTKLEPFCKHPPNVGDTIRLRPGMEVLVAGFKGDKVILDANPPLAGASYSCSFTVLEMEELEPVVAYRRNDNAKLSSSGNYEVATFALGCFWGTELAFMRQPGVVGTRSGYSCQERSSKPTREQLCEETTHHRESVFVIYDKRLVSYKELVVLALERLALTTSDLELHRLFAEDDDDESVQYKHAFFYHTADQRTIAEEALQLNKNRFGVEVLEALNFYEAEESHQQYLYKGGQSGRKGAKETIRCFG
jgi:peptide-methionine (S)-S-oxide reductase